MRTESAHRKADVHRAQRSVAGIDSATAVVNPRNPQPDAHPGADPLFTLSSVLPPTLTSHLMPETTKATPKVVDR